MICGLTSALSPLANDAPLPTAWGCLYSPFKLGEWGLQDRLMSTSAAVHSSMKSSCDELGLRLRDLQQPTNTRHTLWNQSPPSKAESRFATQDMPPPFTEPEGPLPS
jgi:hypothetical protein